MGVCYKAWFNDGFDWSYGNFTKEDFKKQVISLSPHAELLAEFDNWIIFDIDKQYPFDGLFDSVTCDVVLISKDNEGMPIELIRHN